MTKADNHLLLARTLPQDDRSLKARVDELEELESDDRTRRVAALDARTFRVHGQYQRNVNALINGAMRSAHEAVGPEPERGAKNSYADPVWCMWANKFDRAFHAAMDRATLVRGIRRQSHQANVKVLYRAP